MVFKIFYSDVDVHSYRTLKKNQFSKLDSAWVPAYSEKMKFLNENIPFYLHQKWRNIVYELKDRKTKRGIWEFI